MGVLKVVYIEYGFVVYSIPLCNEVEGIPQSNNYFQRVFKRKNTYFGVF